MYSAKKIELAYNGLDFLHTIAEDNSLRRLPGRRSQTQS